MYSYGTFSALHRLMSVGSALVLKWHSMGTTDANKDACYRVIMLTPGHGSPACSLFG